MKPVTILLGGLLALAVTSCSDQQAAPSTPGTEPAQTVELTPEPTVEPVEEPASASPTPSGASSSGDTALEDLIPEELDGMRRTELPGLDAIIGPALAQQGLDPSDAEFVVATYGDGEDAVMINAFRVAGMDQASLEMLARGMAGVDGGDMSAEAVTVAGKSVLRMTGNDAPGAGYLYLAEGAMFTVVSESEALAEQLLAELP